MVPRNSLYLVPGIYTVSRLPAYWYVLSICLSVSLYAFVSSVVQLMYSSIRYLACRVLVAGVQSRSVFRRRCVRCRFTTRRGGIRSARSCGCSSAAGRTRRRGSRRRRPRLREGRRMAAKLPMQTVEVIARVFWCFFLLLVCTLGARCWESSIWCPGSTFFFPTLMSSNSFVKDSELVPQLSRVCLAQFSSFSGRSEPYFS